MSDPIYKLLNRRIEAWGNVGSSRPPLPKPRAPSVTLSGQVGAGRSALGRLLAERLGFDLWDHELLHRVACEVHAPERMLASLDEHALSVLEELWKGLAIRYEPDSYDYMHQLLEVLHTIGHHGAAIIVGRGAQFVLDQSRTLRVRVVGLLADRVRRIMKEDRKERQDAERLVARVDDERARFVRMSYAENIEAAAGYDLIVNTTTVKLPAAVEVILAAYRARFGELPAAR